MKSLLTLCIASSLLLGACAQQTGYRPTVDTYNDPNASRLDFDLQECEQIAQHAGGNTMKDAAIGGAVGGAVGAATGAASGAIYGNRAGTGALAGGAIGALGGAAVQGYKSDAKYKKAYRNCMRNRGHNVID